MYILATKQMCAKIEYHNFVIVDKFKLIFIYVIILFYIYYAFYINFKFNWIIIYVHNFSTTEPWFKL